MILFSVCFMWWQSSLRSTVFHGLQNFELSCGICCFAA